VAGVAAAPPAEHAFYAYLSLGWRGENAEKFIKFQQILGDCTNLTKNWAKMARIGGDNHTTGCMSYAHGTHAGIDLLAPANPRILQCNKTSAVQ
jgi:hypothetical protein